MNELKKLQNAYKAGKLSKEQYQKAVKDLLDEEELTQEEYDDAVDFDPKGDDDTAIYSQADVDRIVLRKAQQKVKQILKDAGVDVDSIPKKDLFTKLAEVVKDGNAAGEGTVDQKELADLRTKVKGVDDLKATNQKLAVENAVLKAAGKYQPYNANQVVRALNMDYADLLEYDDETGAIIQKSVDKALKRIATAEPNLFQAPEGEGTEGGGNNDDDLGGGTFKGKPPGGAGTGGSNKEAEKLAKKKAEALAMLGIKPQN
ncbi:hypothetical protein HWB91_gp69 [Bacillus phage vB_BboS-125]|uniref:Uncharacterized protein n=1 Tax=Bacillus phage vB_BboS-125 TaxID=2419618 RepID=A0A3G3BVZ2_9CAUD|nr:hypothetical protein HWB91_gp69 [Bacillus phage vB_BboS-125]AYP68439.1 hypothetical protein BboS125_00070 [Bacillus phage vB_BboS-125]